MRLKRFWIEAAVGSFGLVLCAVFLFGYQARAAAAKRFGNITYLADSSFLEKAILVDGMCEVREGLLHYSAYYEGHYVYGDFNRDGLQDAAAIISEGEGATGDFRSLAFLINDGRRLIHRVSHYLGDRVIINSLRERDGKVVIDMFVHQEGDCRAGPTKRMKKAYDYLNPNPDLVPQGWGPPQLAKMER